jgi:hypothetical protein
VAHRLWHGEQAGAHHLQLRTERWDDGHGGLEKCHCSHATARGFAAAMP